MQFIKFSYRKETMLATRPVYKITVIIRNYRRVNNPQNGNVLFIIKNIFLKRKKFNTSYVCFQKIH